ncbi:hypothetical protein NX059_011057 [Plenodomus lindquistii]|nr:hypothetical protein NX059_011057 [Plenodomus lindquistii]
MVRRNIGFVSKKAHRKSRGGCFTCKKNKAKILFTKGPYLQIRSGWHGSGSFATSRYLEEETDFSNTPLHVPSWLVTAAWTWTGQLTYLGHELLHHYKTNTWRTFAVRENAIHRSLTEQYLVAVEASGKQALIYRQKTFQMHNEALNTITAENYKAILVTATFLLAFIVPPAGHGPEYDEAYLEWIHALLKLSEGFRILASLRWS